MIILIAMIAAAVALVFIVSWDWQPFSSVIGVILITFAFIFLYMMSVSYNINTQNYQILREYHEYKITKINYPTKKAAVVFKTYSRVRVQDMKFALNPDDVNEVVKIEMNKYQFSFWRVPVVRKLYILLLSSDNLYSRLGSKE